MCDKIYKYFGIRQAGFSYNIMEKFILKKTYETIEKSDDIVSIQTIYEEEYLELSKNLIKLFEEDKFKNVIMLSNLEFFKIYQKKINKHENSLDYSSINGKYKSYIRILMMYLQRICTKNDTSSFFGPCSWGEIVKDEPMNIQANDDTLSIKNKIFISHWALELLIKTIFEDSNLKGLFGKWC